MNELSFTLMVTLAVTMSVMFCLWLVSLRARDVSIVDVYWGPGFAVIAWTAWLLNGAGAGRGLVKTKPEYADDVARTSSFFPMPPQFWGARPWQGADRTG